MNVSVIIPAAGQSRRFGSGDKLNQDLGGRSVLVRTVEIFAKREEVRSIIVAGPPVEFEEFRNRFGATLGFHGAKVVQGGRDHRWETVRNAIMAVPEDATHIAVHDAARPGVSKDLLDRLFDAAQKLPAVIPIVPVSATLKRVSPQIVEVSGGVDEALADAILGSDTRVSIPARVVLETIERENLVEVQTPQIFAADLLRRAYAQSDLRGVTDDAAVVERLGEKVYTVEGDVRNLKITTRADLHLMRAVLGVPPPAERPVHKRF